MERFNSVTEVSFATQRWVPSEARAFGKGKPHPNTFDVGPDGATKEWVAWVFADVPVPDGDVSTAPPEEVAPDEEAGTALGFVETLAASAGAGARPTVAKEAERAIAGSRDTSRNRMSSL